MIGATFAFLIIVSGLLVAMFSTQMEDQENDSSSSSKDESCRVPIDPIEDLLNVAAVYEGNGFQVNQRAIQELEDQTEIFQFQQESFHRSLSYNNEAYSLK